MFASSMRTLISPPLASFPLHLPKPSLFSLAKTPIQSHRKLQTKSSQSQPLSFAPPGEIHVIVGPMFSGKTTTLLRRILSERDLGRKVAVIKSDKDNRYSVSSIVTHDGEKFPCWSLPDLKSFKSRFGIEAYESELDVIGIDEAQFFGDLYEFCREAADQGGKTVIVAGLDGDYLRRKFGSVLDVVPIADTVTKLSSRCEVCGKKGLFTMRKTQEKETELIGGSEVYMPVCRNHYVSGGRDANARVVLDSAKLKMQTQMVDVASV